MIASVSKEVDENASVGETVAVLNAGTDMVIKVGLPESVINLVQQSTKVTDKSVEFTEKSIKNVD